MVTILINPPHSSPVSPPLGLMVVASALRDNDHVVEVHDLGLGCMYHLLTRDSIDEAIHRGEKRLNAILAHTSFPYSLQRQYSAIVSSLAIAAQYAKEAPELLKAAADKNILDSAGRRHAVVEKLNRLWTAVADLLSDGIAYVDGHDYRLAQSPFNAADIESVMQNDRLCIPFVSFLESWLTQMDWSRVALVGIGIAYAKQMFAAVWLARQIKRYSPECPVVYGGSLLGHLTESGLAWLAGQADAVVLGEGEQTLLEIVRSHEAGGGEPRAGTGMVRSGEPYPAFSLASYLYSEENLPSMHAGALSYLSPLRTHAMEVRRGCYWGKCIYCALPSVHKRSKQLPRSAAFIAEQMRLLHKAGIEAIEFVDDALSPEFCGELSVHLIERRIGVKWFGYARFDSGFTRDLLDAMGKAGCVGLKFGLESASRRILKLMNKGFEVGTAKQILFDAPKAGIIPQAAFFAGFPGETEDELRDTLSFIESNVLPNGIVAFNGWFRTMETMPIFNDLVTKKSTVKWNAEEAFIDYYDTHVDAKIRNARLRMVREHLRDGIVHDLQRSVDRRRDYFSPLSAEIEHAEVPVPVYSRLDLVNFRNYSDRRESDFFPGVGMYARKSYIRSDLISKENEVFLDERLPVLEKIPGDKPMYYLPGAKRYIGRQPS